MIHTSQKRTEKQSDPQVSQDYIAMVRELVKSSGIYALASFVSPFISLVLAPFLTRHLSHADYGALAVLNTAIALMGGITQLGLNHAFFRTYNYDYESPGDHLRVVSTLVGLLLLVSLPVTAVMLLAAPWLSLLLFNSPGYALPVRVAVLAMLLQNLSVPGFSWLRAENRAAFFSILSILNLLTTLGANIVLVGVVHLGIAGSLLATAGGYGVAMACTLPVILLRAGVGLHRDIAWNLLSFGLPLVANFVTLWVLQLSDRYLLSRLGSLSQTASYAVGYSLGGVVSSLVLSPFQLAWPTTMFTIARKEDARRIFRLVFRWFSTALLFIAFAFSLVSTGVLLLFFPPAYRPAMPIIPLVALSSMFYGVYIFFTTGLGVRRKNWLSIFSTTAAALMNVGLNIILIPRYGSIGAALATLIAYVALAVLTYIVNQRVYYIPYEIGLFMIAMLVGVGLYALGSILARNQAIAGMYAIYAGALGLYSFFLLLLAIPSLHRGAAIALIRKYLRTQEDSQP